jgi:hypothetical protein
MEPMTVEKLMIPAERFPRISEEETFGTVVRTLNQCHEDYKSGKSEQCILLVHDEKGRVVGKISPMDVLRGLEPQYSKMGEAVGAHTLGASYDHMMRSLFDQATLWTRPLTELCSKARDVKIKDFIRRPTAAQTVDIKDSLDQAVHRFVMGRHDSLFVTDGAQLRGMLLFSNLYAHMSRVMNETCNL